MELMIPFFTVHIVSSLSWVYISSKPYSVSLYLLWVISPRQYSISCFLIYSIISTRQDVDLACGFFITEKPLVQSKNDDRVIYFPPDVFEPTFHCKDVKESEEHGGSQLWAEHHRVSLATKNIYKKSFIPNAVNSLKSPKWSSLIQALIWTVVFQCIPFYSKEVPTQRIN